MATRRNQDTAYVVRDAPEDVLHDRPSYPPPRRSTIRPLGRMTQREPNPERRPDESAKFPTHSSLPPRSSSSHDSLPSHSSLPSHYGAARKRTLSDSVDTTSPVGIWVDQLLICDAGLEEAVLEQLLQSPGAALPHLSRAFRGMASSAPLSPPQRAVLDRAFIAFGPAAMPYIAKLITSPDRSVQERAASLAEAFPLRDVIQSLGEIALTGNETERARARETLRRYRRSAELESLLQWFHDAVTSTHTRQVWRLRGIEALGALPHRLSVPPLVTLLGDQDRSVARMAHGALVKITGHDFGRMRVSWSRWLRNKGGLHRVEWLIDGLADRRVEIRCMAAAQLAQETGLDHGWTVHASYDEHLAIQAHYRRWWERTQRYF